jgi:hypothetical protein
MFIVRFLNNGYLATGGLLNLVLGLRLSGFSKKTQARVLIFPSTQILELSERLADAAERLHERVSHLHRRALVRSHARLLIIYL